MEILSFEGSNGTSKRKRSTKFVAIATIAALGFMGSTFAASITLNSGTLEYGQGVAAAAACDSTMTIIPSNEFTNGPGTGGTFKLKSIVIQDTATSSSTPTTTGLGKCFGKKLKIRAYDSTSGSSPLSLDGTNDYYEVSIPTTPFTSTNLNPSITANGSKATVAGSTDKFTVTIANPSLDASTIFKLTVESYS